MKTALPATAAWRHQQARSGFEVVYFHSFDGGHRIEGCTTGAEERQTWIIEYEIVLDPAWKTRSANVSGRWADGSRRTTLETDGTGRWSIDGEPAPNLDGCLDVDLESSAMTNALPMRRMDLPVGNRTQAPAAYVRALTLDVERLEQSYKRLSDKGAHQRYAYAAPAFEFESDLTYDESGLLLDYPGIAVRVI